MRSLLLSAVMSCIFSFVSAQSLIWWENNVHWDGITPWERYIMYTAGFMGPNALPVPHISNGSTDSVNSLGISGNFYFSGEDHTQNISLYANYCLVKNKISLDAFWVPVEHFTMSHRLKGERNVFALHYYDRYAMGDVHLNTNIQLYNNDTKGVRSALRIGYRFPTSSGLGAARFTDGPGYYFDVSFAKNFNSQPALKWIVMTGGYFWQADNIKRHRQDDAFLFGSGLEWDKNNIRIQTCVTGYLGYFNRLRDKPILFRAGIDKRMKKNTWFFQFQQGLHNYNYSSVEMGMKFNFRKQLLYR